MQKSKAENILTLALEVSGRLLECGGEISRTEDTVKRICKAYGAAKTEVFAIISLVMATTTMPTGETCTMLRRTSSSAYDLSQLESLNAFSRQICSHTPPVDSALHSIEVSGRFRKVSNLRTIAGGIISAAAFAILFGGVWQDSVCAAIAGCAVISFNQIHRLSRFAHTLINSFLGGIASLVLSHLGIGKNPDVVMISVIMLIIPGLSFSISIREMLSGDIVSGSLRMLQSAIVTLAIAGGFVLSAAVMGVL